MNIVGADHAEELSAKLAAADFDNTIAYTFERSPSVIDVEEAYELAISEMFGPDVVQTYKDAGGLKSRYPGEVIKQLAPDASDEEVNLLTEALVSIRLAILLPQIGQTWPRLSDGFLAAWDRLTVAAEQSGDIKTAIVSAGHAPFINKTLDVWGVRQPDILVADEDVRSTEPHIPIEQKVKPLSFPMELALRRWIGLLGAQASGMTLNEAAKKAVYIGDSQEKDGGLARNFDMPFVLVTPNSSPKAWERYTALLGLGTMAVKMGGEA